MHQTKIILLIQCVSTRVGSSDLQRKESAVRRGGGLSLCSQSDDLDGHLLQDQLFDQSLDLVSQLSEHLLKKNPIQLVDGLGIGI